MRRWIQAFLMAGAAAMAGCAVTPRGAGSGLESSGVSPETLARARQARRDVEQLETLAARPDAGGGGAAAARPEVEWTVLPGEPAREAEARVADPPQPVQGTLSRHATTVGAPAVPEQELGGGSDLARRGGGPEAVRELIVELSAELYREAAYSDMPLRELLLIAATTLVTPDRSLVPDALPGLTARERELLGRMQDFFARLGERLVETGDPETLAEAVDELHGSLTEPPPLQLPKAVLCTRVGGFGDYDEFPRNEAGHYAFLAHVGSQAVVYVEVEDFGSEMSEEGEWVTELSQQLIVYSDRDGIPVWREGWQAGVDRSRNRREDFFIVQVITLPKALSVGRYQLKIRIRDEQTGAEAETAVELEMVADPRMVP